VSRFELRTTPGTAFDREPAPIALSPDGRAIAWSACEIPTGRCAIYLRPVDRLEARPLAGTDGGQAPVFSPDGRWIAFFADGALKKIAAAGGAPSTLASAPDPGGAAWNEDGRIVFAGSMAGGLSLIDDQGGAVQALTQPLAGRGELRHTHPAWMARSGARAGAIVFIVAASPDADAAGALAVVAPDSPGVRALRHGIHLAVPAGRSYLLLAAGTDLQAATFDDRALVLTGSTDSMPVPAGDGVPRFAVGGDALAIVRATARPQWIWSDGTDASALARFTSIAIAPDGRRAAGIDNGDVWVADAVSAALTRLTFGGVNAAPVWAADGTRLFFSTRDGSGAFHVVSRPVSDRNDAATPLGGVPAQSFPTSAAADGRVALTIFKDAHAAVGIVSPGGSAPRVLTDGPFDEAAAVFSPDGGWLALESSASGRSEVIVRSAADGRRVAATTSGGRRPRWSEDGRWLYFENGRRWLKAAFDRTAPSLGPPEIVLDRAGDRVVAMAASGRLLIERQPAPDTAVIVQQWLGELRERLPLPVPTPR
jgi:serine/threonine-protein kinase